MIDRESFTVKMKNNVSYLKVIALVFLLQTYTSAEQNAPAKILFVYLNYSNNTLTLQKIKVVDGTLKTERIKNKGNIYYEVFANDGRMISSKVTAISGNTFYDYCGLDGQLKGGARKDENKLIVLRLPYVPVMKNIFLYSTKTTQKTGLSKTNNLTVEKDSLIAVIPLNPPRAHSSELCSEVSEQSDTLFSTDRRIPRSSTSGSFSVEKTP